MEDEPKKRGRDLIEAELDMEETDGGASKNIASRDSIAHSPL